MFYSGTWECRFSALEITVRPVPELFLKFPVSILCRSDLTGNRFETGIVFWAGLIITVDSQLQPNAFVSRNSFRLFFFFRFSTGGTKKFLKFVPDCSNTVCEGIFFLNLQKLYTYI